MSTSEEFNVVFDRCVEDYHIKDSVDTPIENPYPAESFEHLLYAKNWTDAVNWHFEDIIRLPNINPTEALEIKRKIDRLNQQRVNFVEAIDCHFMEKFAGVKPLPGAYINTETPAWAIDRLSILALKIYHMRVETVREGATEAHK